MSSFIFWTSASFSAIIASFPEIRMGCWAPAALPCVGEPPVKVPATRPSPGNQVTSGSGYQYSPRTGLCNRIVRRRREGECDWTAVARTAPDARTSWTPWTWWTAWTHEPLSALLCPQDTARASAPQRSSAALPAGRPSVRAHENAAVRKDRGVDCLHLVPVAELLIDVRGLGLLHRQAQAGRCAS